MPRFILKITAADNILTDNEDICCYLADENSAPSVLDAAVRSDKLVLACGDNAAEFCVSQNLDGVLTGNAVDEKYAKFIKQLQKQIGSKKFFGAVVNASRHEAMLASETEPEFVAFRADAANIGGLPEILDWYAELFLIQSALVYDKNLPPELWTKTDFLILNSEDYKILVDKIKRLD